jgi:MFS family permease
MSQSALSSGQAATGTEHPIRNAGYRRWLLASTVSVFGDQFYLVALPWLILQGLGSAGMLATVMMAGALPRAALMLLGGAVTDRVSARLVMLTTAGVRAVCVAAIGCLAWLDALSAWEVYALVIVFGIADAFAIPAQTSYMPALLAEEQLVAGMSFGQGCDVVAYTLGPIPAGLAVARLGPGPALLIDVVGFLVVIAALLRLPDPPVVPAQAKNAIGAIRDGIAHVLSDVPLRTMMLLVGATNLLGAGATSVGLAFLASVRFGSSTAYGVILSAGAAGAFVGTLAAGAWKPRQRGLLIVVCLGMFGMGLASIPLVPGVWGIAAVQFFTGVSGGVCSLHIMAWIMQRVDVAFRGRVSSVLMLTSWGMDPISMALSGYLATWSIAALFVVPGTCLVAVAAGATLLRSVREIR